MLESRLRQDGFCVFSFNLGTFNTRDIRRSAFLIHRKIENILTQSPVKKLDILGFSMGGLIGLYYVKKLGGSERVRKLVLLGSPVRGTWAALAGVWLIGLRSSSAWQLLPGSDFLAELGEGSLPPSVTYYSIAALRDWLCPVRSTVLDGGYSVSVPYGHSSLVFSEDVYRHIRWALAHRPAAPGATVPLDWALAEG
jgi:triacylglycerol esterase/lipase EstA (alpha/beta hydrolase family)